MTDPAAPGSDGSGTALRWRAAASLSALLLLAAAVLHFYEQRAWQQANAQLNDFAAIRDAVALAAVAIDDDPAQGSVARGTAAASLHAVQAERRRLEAAHAESTQRAEVAGYLRDVGQAEAALGALATPPAGTANPTAGADARAAQATLRGLDGSGARIAGAMRDAVERGAAQLDLRFVLADAIAALVLIAAFVRMRQIDRARLRSGRDLWASEDKYRAMVLALDEGVLIFDGRGRVQASNPSAERMLGATLAQMQASRIDDWTALDAAGAPLPPERMPVTLALKQGVAQRNVTMGNVDPSGRLTWFNVNTQPLHDAATGRNRGAVVSFTDITEPKRVADELELHRGGLAERVEARTRELSAALAARADTQQRLQELNAALQQADEFTRLVADNIPGRVAYWDRELRCRFVNRIYCEWFGFAREALIGRSMTEIFGPERLESMRHAIDAALLGTPQEFERDEISADGQAATTLVHYVPDLRAGELNLGEVRGFFVLALDVTQNRLAKQTLQRLNAELVVARDRAEAAASAKSAFLATMSHEIRTPMNAIIGLTHLLRRENASPQAGDRLTRIADAAAHLLQILNDILDLSKIESGKLVLEQTDFRLDALLSRSGALVAEQAQAKGLELVIDASGVPNALRGDPTRLSQALVNLLSNAVKFTERGSVSLIGSVLETNGGELLLRFEVRDTGIGIEPQRIEGIFSAFEQADSSTTRRFGGTGLGLGITRHLARLMGGDAGASSAPGIGSTFWITLRVQAQTAPNEIGPDALLSGLRALVVDDMAEARDVLTAMLRRLGLRAEGAASGPEALARVAEAERAEDPYAIVVIDWLMPHMDGLATARRMLECIRGDAPACIMISNSSDAQMREQALDLGITSLLQKPISLSTLHDHLVEALVERDPTTRPGTLELLTEHALRAEHQGARVLLAEDNPVNQEVATMLLRLAGLVVDVAQTGHEAVAMAAGGRYELILMDMQMPELDGLCASRQLRTMAATAATPIIAMTANAYAEDRAACLAAGMNDFITKPVDPPALYDMLAQWLPKPVVRAPALPLESA